MPGRIHESCGVLAIDFQHCDARQVQLAYENLALRLCSTRGNGRVLVRAGEEHAELHYALLGVLRAVAQILGAPLQLEVAIIGASPALAAVCAEMLARLAALGCEVKLFHAASTGARWLLAHEPALA